MQNGSLLWLFLLQLLFISMNAVFACAEIAVITMNDNKLAKLAAAGDKRALLLTRLTQQPSAFLATIQVGITLVNLLSSAVATKNFSDRLTAWLAGIGISLPVSVVSGISVAVITLGLTYFTVLLGELVPKRVAMRKAEQIALGMSGLIFGMSRLFTPAVWLFTVSADGLMRLFGMDPKGEDSDNTEEEIRMMLDAGKEKGTIEPDEQSMIQNIFEFDDTTAGEIMTHRTEVFLLWMDETAEEWDTAIHDSRHSVYPVCSESPDDIVGVLHTKDYFRLKDKSRESVMKGAVQPAYFVPESVPANVLFRNMKKTRNHFAVVVDEYGGMSGIVTMNDLLEELVGDLDDDKSAPEKVPDIEELGPGTWNIQGAAPLDDVARQLKLVLPEEDYDTFGGYVFGMLGKVPDDGATPELTAGGMIVRVAGIRDRRLESAIVTLASARPQPEDAPETPPEPA